MKRKAQIGRRTKLILVLAGITAASLIGLGLAARTHQASSVAYHPPAPTKLSGCVAMSGLADRACTPGADIATATKAQICKSGYASSVRHVTDTTKAQVFAEYGITTHPEGAYEVDHLISLELGGSNDIANLWPEAADPVPGFHQKDQVENYLHRQVCDGKLSLRQAQEEIAINWLQVYATLVH